MTAAEGRTCECVERASSDGQENDYCKSCNDVGGTESDVGGAESDVGGAESDVGGAESDVGGAESDAGGAESAATDVEADMLCLMSLQETLHYSISAAGPVAALLNA